MLKLIIEDDEGRKTVVPFVREEITIGRQEGNTIRLTERNVSRRHARLMRQNGHVVVEDLGSSNGTRINGERISGQSTVKDGDLIQIGDYDLALQSEAGANAITSRIRQAPEEEEAGDSDAAAAAAEPETELETPVQEEDPAHPPLGAPDQRRNSTAIIKMDQVEGRPTRKVEELEAEEAPRLVVVSAELKGQEYACIRTEMKIGRTDDNDIVIDHRSLSRTHAKIVREDNGEWRIIDMQSANGLTVNGESYAQAPLNSGDVVELGHVKLRFVAAGEAVGALGGGRGKLPLVLGAVGVVVLLVGVAFVLKVGPFSPGPGPDPKPPEVTQEDPTPTPTDPTETPDTRPPETPPQNTAAESAKKLAERIQRAQKEFDQGNLDKAEDELKQAQNPEDGSWPPAAQPLANQLASERKAYTAITDAKSALDQRKYDDALALLAGARGSKLFGPQHDALRAEIDEARKSQPKPPTVNNNPKPPVVPAVNPQEEAKTAQDDAARLLRARQYNDAVISASKCVQFAPDNADCHMMLGAAYAGVANYDKAAEHYSRFLKLAPDHKLAPKVRATLENYTKVKPP